MEDDVDMTTELWNHLRDMGLWTGPKPAHVQDREKQPYSYQDWKEGKEIEF